MRYGLNTHSSKLKLLIHVNFLLLDPLFLAPTFHLHSSVNSEGCHQDHFSTRVRVCSSRRQFHSCQRIRVQEFKAAFSRAALVPFSVNTHLKGKCQRTNVPVKHRDVCVCVCMCICVCVCLCLQRFILWHCLVMFGPSLSQLWRDIEPPLISFTAMTSASFVRPDQIYQT